MEIVIVVMKCTTALARSADASLNSVDILLRSIFAIVMSTAILSKSTREARA
jgi:hypothetical protein